VRVVVTGLADVVKEIAKQKKAYNKAVDNAVLATAVNIQRDAVLGINKQQRDLGDKGSKRGTKRHYSGPEGDFPNTDLGGLVGSIAVQHMKGTKEAIVFSDLDYAAYLEFVLNRPWLSLASEGKEKVLKENILTFTNKALK
jgi:hypothetical protein